MILYSDDGTRIKARDPQDAARSIYGSNVHVEARGYGLGHSRNGDVFVYDVIDLDTGKRVGKVWPS